MTDSTKTGLVAFFDILGYSAFLENNEPEDAAKSINEFLERVEMLSDTTFINRFGESKESVSEVVVNIRHVIISDSILLTLECDRESARYDWRLLIFLLYCAALTKELFMFGLPTRGCVEYGEFYIAKNTFAGKPIIRAYKNSESIDLSACMVSESVITESFMKNGVDIILLEHLIPKKNNEEKGYLINHLIEDGDESEMLHIILSDPTQFVVKSFSAYNKHIGISVHKKITNTEMFIRLCIIQRMDEKNEL